MVEPIRRALEGTLLGGREVRPVPVPGTSVVGYELDGDGDEQAAWKVARERVARLGWWPLVVDAFGADVYSREYYRSIEETPQRILYVAQRLSPEEAVARRREFRGVGFPYSGAQVDRLLSGFRSQVERRVDDSPSEAELDPYVATRDWIGLERFLLEWEEARRPTDDAEVERLHALQRTGLEGGPFNLALIPTANPVEVPAYSGFWNCQGSIDGHETLVAALRGWHQRFGAEPLSNNGVHFSFYVPRPPQDVYGAFELALEHRTFSDQDASLRALARSLIGNARWTLIGRP
jgi:Domain of unknown function (DUF4253)